jgi:YidC/Oxa1 family membrane protein insertase
MGENRNMFIAIALSLAIIVLWQLLYVQPRMEAQEEAARRQAEIAQQASPTAPTAVPGAPATATPPGASPSDIPAAPAAGDAAIPQPAGAATPADAATVATAPRVPIETPRVSGSLSLLGGRLDDLHLKDYHVTVDPASPTVTLLSPLGTASPYYVESGWVPSGNVAVPTPNTVWTLAEGERLTPETPVVLEWNNGAGLTFRRTVAIDANYMFTVTQTVLNEGDAPVTLLPYSRVRRQGTPQVAGFWILHEGMIGVLGEEGLVQWTYSDLSDEETGVVALPQANEGWVGITDKYWATTVIPDPGTTYDARFLYTLAGNVPAYQADYLAAAVTVAPGATAESVNRVFAGAKETNLIRSYEDSLNIDRFNLLIDWGWFYFITKPMFDLIDFIYGFVGNFGVAILIVTLLIKLVFFPLAQRAYTSMAKMKKLQPEMTKLRDRYKDDRVKQQQAMMELYKKEKVNPLAGCVPILIQIPVFFALYKVLFVTIEMRHAPFFGWIEDLSAPDPTSIFNLFGVIPWDPSTVPVIGAFLMLGVWPIIMGITMWLQMKMNPAPPDPTQAMIFNWMPIFFTFLLASFPAGLVIYWAWNNSLSVLQQYVIMRRQGVKVELWDNVSGMFRRKKEGGAT